MNPMKDVIGGMGASWWQEAALVIFLITFVAIVVHAWLRSKTEIELCSRLPMDEPPEISGAALNGAGPGSKRAGGASRESEGASL